MGVYDVTILTLISETTQELRNGTQISIAVTFQDSIYLYGVKRENDLLITHNNKSVVFEIGSITKVMTAYVIHSLAQQGELHIQDAITDYLSINNDHLNGVIIQSVINHTSGLARMPDNLDLFFNDDPYKDYSKQDLYNYLVSLDREIIAGDQECSNLGYGILGAIAEETSGKTMSELYEELIFDPLGMDNSSFHLDS